MNTILIDPVSGDLLLDSDGNIAKASNPYAIAQDVASEIKLFLGELYYDTSRGLPYFEQILGQDQGTAASMFASLAESAALLVPEVVVAKTTQLYYNNRVLSGVVEIIDTTGSAQSVQF